MSVLDLQTGRIVSVNGDRQQPAACTIKIFIMIAVAQDIEAGKYSADDVEGLVLSAMGPSNTPPAYELMRIAGGGDYRAGLRRVNDIMKQLGMTALGHSDMRPTTRTSTTAMAPATTIWSPNELSVALGQAVER